MTSEKLAEENEECRKIIKEINNFGVTQRQILLIIYLLSLELENAEEMKIITDVMKEEFGKKIFVSQFAEKEG